jgi:rifampicin phosphotransferase
MKRDTKKPNRSTVEWCPPGPGQWNLDRSHYPGGTTPISQWLVETGLESGTRRVFREQGAPVAAISARFVHGFMYTRTVPLIGARRSLTKLPPSWVVRGLTRVHPEFRRRARRAAAALANPPGDEIVRLWTHELKPMAQRRNDAFADVDVGTLSDTDLATHCRSLLDHLHAMADLHFWLHGHDLGPIARYIEFAHSCGLPTLEAVSALAGASPSTTRPQEQLSAIRSALSGQRPSSLAEVRTMSPVAGALLVEYLREHGATLVTGYDLPALTLAELPTTLFDAITGSGSGSAQADAQPAPVADSAHDDCSWELAASTLRAKLPAHVREGFDERLQNARMVMDMRDDNGPTLLQRPTGLLRLTLLEIGRRLHASDSMTSPEHVFELGHEEVVPLLRFGKGPGRFELEQRAAIRIAASQLTPPSTLGSLEPRTDVRLLPGPLAELAGAISTALEELGMFQESNTPDPLSGTGVGAASYTGRARRCDSYEDAFVNIRPGDVLLVRATSPAFNVVMSIAGAVVTADGGPLSHAAVLARELSIPAVIGARGALDIPDGAIVTVNPTLGTVRVLS